MLLGLFLEKLEGESNKNCQKMEVSLWKETLIS